jgi:hypothetical protein
MDKKNIFRMIFSISLLLFLFSSYWIYKNVKFEDLIGPGGNSSDQNNDTLDNDKRIFEIRDNNIVQIFPSGEVSVLINLSNIEDAEAITDFSNSPDNKKMCFLVQTIVPIWMYVYDLETGELSKVDVAQNCFWSPNSAYLAYNNHITDVSSIDVYIYDVEKKESKNISENIVTESTDVFRQCKTISWEDEKNLSLECEIRKYSNIDEFSVFDFKYNLENEKITSKQE